MAKNMHKKSFSKETQLKLDIFRECFKEWFPVFLHAKFCQGIYVYDLFAGSGYDKDGSPGSPIILLNEAMGDNAKHCVSIKKNNIQKQICFIFNEYEPNSQSQLKYKMLASHLANHRRQCEDNNSCNKCHFDIYPSNKDFAANFIGNKALDTILNDNKKAKLIFIDQYGFKHVDKDVFNKLINSPLTDFIFFISSSSLNRFKEHDVTKRFLGDKSINFDENTPKKCHQVIVKYFESLIPDNKEYYLNHFTIKKGANYYGLIFGSAHTLGMEKFQRVCWQEDSLAGESNCNTQNDFGGLFANIETPNKIISVKEKLKKEILSAEIKDNIEGLKRALKYRCLPSVFTEVVKELIKSGRIQKSDCKGYKSSDIHRIKQGGEHYYTIEIL